MSERVILCMGGAAKGRVHHLPTVQEHWMHVREPEQFSDHVSAVKCPTCLSYIAQPHDEARL